ncbi:carotenoid oxygenase family protein [Actinomadura barringtoniae]|uniref:Dioxygenase n=1 Tax=Actinomadura barringtoniae TaxID=1427535 RepID=A0A939P5X4_9ACTN|nr:carotenoid oxygenase family protein [Actinomadura barringtoniae]
MTEAKGRANSGNAGLDGNYAPVRQELTVTDLDVTGTIPGYLDGRYLRNGPNPFGDPDPERYEWFAGTGMVHGLRIQDGRAVWYRNRWVRSAEVSRALGERRRSGPHRGGLDFAASINVIGHAGRTLVLNDAGVRPYELTDELDTVGPSDFCGTLYGGYSAHPKRDPVTGELHAVSYGPFRGNSVQYTVTGVDGRIRRAVDIPVDARTMMHDFSLTERHVVLYHLPVVLDLRVLLRSRPGRTLGSLLNRLAGSPMPGPLARGLMRASSLRQMGMAGVPFRWDTGHRPRVGVMPREGSGSDIRWFDVGPSFVYHALNAYDEGDRVVLEVARHSKVYADGGWPFGDPPTLDRWTIDLVAGRVREERIDDRSQEFPRVDERRVGRRHRFGYTVGYGQDAEWMGSPDVLLKHDVERRSVHVAWFGEGREPGEFVFVPSSDDAAEDDGVVMGFVYDRASDRSDLVMLDAATLETAATVHLPARVPHGIHGNWVPSAG